MIDISVKDLVKSFDADTNILDGITFDVQSGERVGLLLSLIHILCSGARRSLG